MTTEAVTEQTKITDGALRDILREVTAEHNAGNDERALELAYRAVNQRPDSYAAHWEYGSQLHSAGDLALATAELRIAARLAPHNVDVLYTLSSLLDDLGEHNEAVAVAEVALRLSPLDAEIWNNLGVAFEHLGRRHAAGNAYRQAISLKPDNARYHRNLGNVLKLQYRNSDALRSYRRAIALDSTAINAYLGAAECLISLGKHAAALRTLQKAAALDAADYVIKAETARVYWYLGQTEKAARIYRGVMSQLARDDSLWDDYVDFLRSESRYPEALHFIRLARRRLPNSDTAGKFLRAVRVEVVSARRRGW